MINRHIRACSLTKDASTSVDNDWWALGSARRDLLAGRRCFGLL